MKKRFAEFLVLLGCAVLFFWAAPGLYAEEDDEFDLAPPPAMNVQKPENDAPKPGNDAEKPGNDSPEPRNDSPKPGNGSPEPGNDSEKPKNDSPDPADDELPPAPELEAPDLEPVDEAGAADETPGRKSGEEVGERLDGVSEEETEEISDGDPEKLQKNGNSEEETELPSPESALETEKSQSAPDLKTNLEPELDLEPEIFLGPEFESEKGVEPEQEEEPKIQYASPKEMEELKEKIQKILKIYRNIGLSTAENSPNDIMFFIMTYGCEAEIFLGCREANTHINAIGALCWNVPMKESVAFTGSTEKLMPRLGYGIQQYSGQLLAAMAIARVPIDYRFPAGWTKVTETEEKEDREKEEKNKESNVPKLPKGKKNFAIRDLVEFEQKNCLWGRDLSLTLIGLSYYLEPDEEWESNDGEKWTLERVVENELDREMKLDDSSATNQLLGLLCAIRCRKMRLGEDAITGEFKHAEVFMERYRKFVLDLQNEIGVWHPKFFELKGVTPNQPTEMLEASGHILRWLVTVTSKSELKDERVFKAVKIVTELLEYQLTYWDPGNASGKEVEGIMTALHALMIYEKRAW